MKLTILWYKFSCFYFFQFAYDISIINFLDVIWCDLDYNLIDFILDIIWNKVVNQNLVDIICLSILLTSLTYIHYFDLFIKS